MASDHHVAQLIQRLGSAVTDAKDDEESLAEQGAQELLRCSQPSSEPIEMKRTYRYQPVGPGTVFPERGGPELATASLYAPEAAPYVLPGSRTRAASTLTDPAVGVPQ